MLYALHTVFSIKTEILSKTGALTPKCTLVSILRLNCFSVRTVGKGSSPKHWKRCFCLGPPLTLSPGTASTACHHSDLKLHLGHLWSRTLNLRPGTWPVSRPLSSARQNESSVPAHPGCSPAVSRVFVGPQSLLGT